MMVAMLSIGFESCSKDDDDKVDNYENTENISNQDPEGTIVLNMISGASGNYYNIGSVCSIHVDEANNFTGEKYSGVSIVSVGLVSGLGKITQIPNSGWAQSAAVVPGTGYVLRCDGQYARIYVVDYLAQSYTDEQGNMYGMTNGMTNSMTNGITIKYQAPFQLPIKLDVTSLSFDSSSETKTLELLNPTTINVEEKPEWCEVSTNSNSITVKVSENLTAEQRQGEILLKNTSNSVKISVTQKGASAPMFQAGSGTIDDPYQIKTAQQLKSITKALNAHFILTSDITLDEEVNGSGWDPIGKKETPFMGTIDGQGHTIKNLWIKRPTTNYVGLFGYVQDATITSIRIEIGNNGLTGGDYVGGICGFVCDYNGNNCTISKCSVKGAISGNSFVGGICGNIYVDGKYSKIEIYQCFSEGNLTSNIGAYGIGRSESHYGTISISNCYSTISLSGNGCYGISGGNITKCYFAGKASPTQNSYFTCSGTYTYFDKTIIGTNRLYETNSRTTSQMKTQSNYEGWDFTSTWKITEGKTYPTLRCFDK